jgi:hypothetical protein
VVPAMGYYQFLHINYTNNLGEPKRIVYLRKLKTNITGNIFTGQGKQTSATFSSSVHRYCVSTSTSLVENPFFHDHDLQKIILPYTNILTSFAHPASSSDCDATSDSPDDDETGSFMPLFLSSPWVCCYVFPWTRILFYCFV